MSWKFMICSFRVIKINWIRSDEQGKVAYLSNWQFFVDKGRIPFIFQFQSGILRILIQFHLQNTQHFLVITLKTLLSLFHITSFGLTPWVSFFGFNVNFNLIFNTSFQGEFREIYGDPQLDVGSAKRVINSGFLLVKSGRLVS